MQTTTLESVDKNTLNNLNDLVEINLDSEKGFRETADNLKSDIYEKFFYEIADERRHQAEKLKGLISMHGGESAEEGSLKGQAHRWWTQLRDKVSDSPNYAVLAEAERGEDKILHLYQDVVDKTANMPVYDLVLKQKAQVKQRHDQVRDLRDRAKEIEDK